MLALASSLAKLTPVARLEQSCRDVPSYGAVARRCARHCAELHLVALTVNAVTLFGLGFGVDISPSVAFLVVPVAVIFSSLPISVGGWGVRKRASPMACSCSARRRQTPAWLGSHWHRAFALVAAGRHRRVGAERETTSDIPARRSRLC